VLLDVLRQAEQLVVVQDPKGVAAQVKVAGVGSANSGGRRNDGPFGVKQ